MTIEYRTQIKPVAASAKHGSRRPLTNAKSQRSALARPSSASEQARDEEKKAHAPTFCDTLNFSAGLPRSFTPAITKHHFIIGPQKKTVFGPVHPNRHPSCDPSPRRVQFAAFSRHEMKIDTREGMRLVPRYLAQYDSRHHAPAG